MSDDGTRLKPEPAPEPPGPAKDGAAVAPPPRSVGAFPPPSTARVSRAPAVPEPSRPIAHTLLGVPAPLPVIAPTPAPPPGAAAPPVPAPAVETRTPTPARAASHVVETPSTVEAPPAVPAPAPSRAALTPSPPVADAAMDEEPPPVIEALAEPRAVESLLVDEVTPVGGVPLESEATPVGGTPLVRRPPPATAPSEPVRADVAPSTESPGVPQEPASAPPAGGPSASARAEASSEVTSRVVVILMVASLVMVLFHLQNGSRENANTGSRYATVESLVDFGTWNIDSTHYVFTPDKVKARGHFVSSKPPLLPAYGAGVYYVLKKITGYDIGDNEGIVVWTVSLLTGWLSHLVFLIYFYRLSRLLLVRQLAIILTMAAACFAYLGVAYATAINNHSPGAALAVVGFYFAYRARNGLGGRLDYMLAGFWLGVLPAIDLSSAALTGFCVVYLGARNLRRTLLLYVPATLPGLASEILLAHAATGSWIPAYADTGLMQYAGSYFGGTRSGIDALFESKPTYAFHVLLGHHGLFSMTPIFGFAAFELVRRLVRRDRLVAETAVFLATVGIVCAFYIFRTHNYGGWCVGMRWLVPVMPWLLLGFGLWLDRAVLGRVKWSLVILAFAVSAFNVQDGLTSPFQFSLWHNFLDGAPNRNRLGPKWNLSRPVRPRPRPTPPPPRPKPRPTLPATP